MVRNHGALVKSLGSMAVPGLEDPDYMVQVELEDDENGPRPSPGSMSMRMILMQLKILGKRFITAVAPSIGDGVMTIWFNGVDYNTIEMAKQMLACLASYSYIFLRKRGWTQPFVRKLIKYSFDGDSADAATRARECKITGRIIPGRSRRQRQSGAGSSWYVMELGLTEEEKAERDAPSD